MREQIIKYVGSEYNTKEEHPWRKYPDYVVLRHNDNNKWYALIMNVPKYHLGLTGNDEVDVINVKCPSVMIGNLRQSAGYLPAYHMNKDSWITIVLDGTVSMKEICDLIDQSYFLTQ
ncbi:MmcQ/YjbR family DNA-binding protein [Bartonella apis]|uniref:Putative DNA-binding protein, MmcQ/YjbR family n=1 Tax=Bartonella apis TaxID=1686310 RepID=A0A1R0FB22_9HYPH|nr:MmcQ/YjbR family DNA-binding protein [Bartonella apis]MCT6860944.1 MmcQ/YjbR family DNA-binding protein [Bartonella apis]OLY44092.1 putative DNA-binding protein, MmcQ/YjbR family [Bartonella apis]